MRGRFVEIDVEQGAKQFLRAFLTTRGERNAGNLCLERSVRIVRDVERYAFRWACDRWCNRLGHAGWQCLLASMAGHSPNVEAHSECDQNHCNHSDDEMARDHFASTFNLSRTSAMPAATASAMNC